MRRGFMAESRVEKFKEYRKSIIGEDDSGVKKEAIDTSLKQNSVESKNGPSSTEEEHYKNLSLKKRLNIIFFLTIFLLIVSAIVVFGIILF